MRPYLSVLLLLAGNYILTGQPNGAPDTLLVLNFSNPDDTLMLPASSGNDNHWVNWDGDQLTTGCGEKDTVPGAWYRESDLGETTSSPVNYAYTSCSWLAKIEPNNNWLITPPIQISDSSYRLSWRSLSFQGPQHLDGYKVLVSESLNLPDTAFFKDTLFAAAEMLGNEAIYTLNLEDYQFSPGYIHADSYQDQNYFFIDINLGGVNGLFHGKLEPHAVSLAAYSGKTIYIAFVHDSENDFILQIDDIVVSNQTSAVRDIPELTRFSVQPNPVRETAVISWELSRPLPDLRLRLSNISGQVIWETPVGNSSHANYFFDASTLAPGIFFCTLDSGSGQSTRKLVKL
ncbi:MAG: T9SS type A sorting domain-containing protein [Thermoanaerobaculia bacterium]|nr:T9SS type A sorting domain-containing protein [Thermoanaerobaculia bacterium]